MATCNPPHSKSWERQLLTVYCASTFIFVRSVFRLAEFVGGEGDVLLQHEYYIYIFDATLMLLAMLLFNVFYPTAAHDGDVQPRNIFLWELSQHCRK